MELFNVVYKNEKSSTSENKKKNCKNEKLYVSYLDHLDRPAGNFLPLIDRDWLARFSCVTLEAFTISGWLWLIVQHNT